jgi:hypothetical protein
MAVAMFMRFTGISRREYDQVIASLELDISPAPGHIVHVAGETQDGLLVCDVWQTKETAESFVGDVLEPRLAAMRLAPDLNWEIFPLHNLYAPDLDTIERIGAVSLPAYASGVALR